MVPSPLVIKSKPKEAPRIPLSLGFCCGGFKLCPQTLGHSSAQKGAQSPSPEAWAELSGSLQTNRARWKRQHVAAERRLSEALPTLPHSLLGLLPPVEPAAKL